MKVQTYHRFSTLQQSFCSIPAQKAFSNWLRKLRAFVTLTSLAGLMSILGVMTSYAGHHKKAAKPIALLDKDLSQWEIWLGVPHSSVKGLPKGTYQSDNVRKGQAIGLKNLKSVFSTFEENGETILHVSGEIYGGITTKKSFKNYHLQLQVKWGEKKWEPRLEDKRDSGLLYHCNGPHGSFWQVWKSCLEYQIQEKDFGDFIALAGTSAMFRGKTEEGRRIYAPELDTLEFSDDDYIHATKEPDLENGKWNTVDLYVYENKAIHVVNGVLVFAISDAKNAYHNTVTEGQIQLQSEAAECFYKNIVLTPIKSFPKNLKLEARF